MHVYSVHVLIHVFTKQYTSQNYWLIPPQDYTWTCKVN